MGDIRAFAPDSNSPYHTILFYQAAWPA